MSQTIPALPDYERPGARQSEAPNRSSLLLKRAWCRDEIGARRFSSSGRCGEDVRIYREAAPRAEDRSPAPGRAETTRSCQMLRSLIKSMVSNDQGRADCSARNASVRAHRG